MNNDPKPSPLKEGSNNIANLQKPDKLLKDCQVILHCPDMHSETEKERINQLKDTYRVNIFTDWEEAAAYVENNVTNYIVITSETNAEFLVKAICEKSNVLSINVFYKDTQAKPQWTEKYKQVIFCIESDFQTIISKIKIKYGRWIRKSSTKPLGLLVCLPAPNNTEVGNNDSMNEEINIMASVQEIKRMFFKECVLVLYHPDANSKPMTDNANQLQGICELKIFTKWEEAADYVSNSKVDCCIITSEANGELFIKEVYKKENIFSINIYCNNAQLRPQWIKLYRKKIMLVENDFQVIAQKIKEQIFIWQEGIASLRLDIPIFSPIFNDYDKSDNNYLNIYLNELVKFGTRTQRKNDFLTLARAVYTGKDTGYIDDFDKDYNAYNMGNILMWYTRESFLCKLVNNSLRLAKPDTIYYSRFILEDLEAAIKEQYKKKSKSFNGVLYRAAYISDVEWAKLQQNKGGDIEMHGFLSTSKSKEVIEFFMEEKKSLITIIVPPILNSDASQGFAEVEEFSDYKDEQEVLFNVRSRFTILETTFAEVAGSKYQHLILLYGAQDMRTYMSRNNPTIQIRLDDSQVVKCIKCQFDIQLPHKIMFVNIEKIHEHVCYDCMKTNKNLDLTALVAVKPMSELTIKIEGMIAKYNENLDIPFYGYKCKGCQSSRIQGKIICQTCKDTKKEWCNSCFDADNSCVNADHVVIAENQPYRFWSDKLEESALIKMGYKYEFNENGQLFMNVQDYPRARQYYEKQLELNQKNNNKEYIAIMSYKLGTVLYHLGQFEQAKECLMSAVDTAEAFYGDKHPAVAASNHSLGAIFDKLGKLEEAIQCYFKSHKIIIEFYGDKHPDAAASYMSFGNLYLKLKQHEKAMESFSKSLEISREVYGDMHPKTISCYHCLGLMYETLGKFDEALAKYTKSLSIRKAIFGDKHSDTVMAYQTLSHLHQRWRKLDKALEYGLKGLEVAIAVYGKDHLEVASYYTNIGEINKGLGKIEEAIKFHSYALEIRKPVLGNNHFYIGQSYNILASLYQQSGQLEKAVEYNLRAVEVMKAVDGGKNAPLGYSYNNLGSLYMSLKQYDQACACFLSALELLKLIHRPEEPLMESIYRNLGLANKELGKFDQSLECSAIASQMRPATNREKDSLTAQSYTDMGIMFEKSGEFEKAEECYLKALKINQEVDGERHINTATSYNNLGFVYRLSGQSEKALECYYKGLEIIQKIGNDQILTSAFYHNLASLHHHLKQSEKALDYFTKVLKIRIAVCGNNHADVAEAYFELGSVYQDLKQCDKAVEYYSAALKIAITVHGYLAPVLVKFYSHLGVAHQGLRQLDKAIECQSHALQVCKAVFGPQDSYTAAAYNNIGVLHQQLGQLEKAMECYSNAVLIGEAASGAKNPALINYYTSAGSVQKQLGQFERAKEHYRKALEVSKALYGDNNPTTANLHKELMLISQQPQQSNNTIAFLQGNADELEKAIKQQSKMLEEYKTTYGLKHFSTGSCYHSLGVAYRKLGQFEKARQYYTIALYIGKTVFENDHICIAASYSELGHAYQGMKQFEKAVEYLSKALNILKKNHGNKHSDLAHCHHSLGTAYQSLEQLDKAIEHFSNAWEICKELHGDQDQLTIYFLEQLEFAQCQILSLKTD